MYWLSGFCTKFTHCGGYFKEFYFADVVICEHPMLDFFDMILLMQLLAMEIMTRMGNDVDMPRNLINC